MTVHPVSAHAAQYKEAMRVGRTCPEVRESDVPLETSSRRDRMKVEARYEVPGNGTEDTSVPAGTIETVGARFRIRFRERELVIRSSTPGRIGF